MFKPEDIYVGYQDYRESIGRPRVGIEDLKQSIPYAHFRAGVDWAIKNMHNDLHNQFGEEEVENAEDAL